MLQIDEVKSEGNMLNIVRDLFRDYERELATDLTFQRFDDEVKNPLARYGAPKGKLFIALWNGEPAGCIALAPMSDDCCEMKRLYVLPNFRMHGIGKALVEHLLAVAREMKYSAMRLDTFKKLQSAIRLYENYGFHYIEPYYHNPFPDVVYMEKSLAD